MALEFQLFLVPTKAHQQQWMQEQASADKIIALAISDAGEINLFQIARTWYFSGARERSEK